MRFDTYLQSFKEHLKERNAAERTVQTYLDNSRLFLEFLSRYYPRITSIQKVSHEIVKDYQRYLTTCRGRSGRPLSTQTQILKLTVLRAFFAHLLGEDLILQNPAAGLHLPKAERRLPRNILSEKEVQEILEKLDGTDPVSLRNRAVVELFYGCGIRTTELCRLKVEDVDLNEQIVTIVRGKGGKSRVVPIGQYGAYYLQRYLEKARKYMWKGKRSDPGYLFLSQRGNPYNATTINKSVMRPVGRLLSAGKYISGYTWRHSVASHLLAHQVDITYISRLLGHASLRTTQRYVHVEIGDLRKMHSLYHPREISSLNPADG